MICDSVTTTIAGSIMGVAARTVVKWCERGIIPFWKYPYSNHRRIKVKHIITFMKQQGIPMTPDEEEHLRRKYHLDPKTP